MAPAIIIIGLTFCRLAYKKGPKREGIPGSGPF